VGRRGEEGRGGISGGKGGYEGSEIGYGEEMGGVSVGRDIDEWEGRE